MPKPGFRSVTVSEELYRWLVELAGDSDLSIPRFILHLVIQYRQDLRARGDRFV